MADMGNCIGNCLTYANRIILAPMVRIGTLPTRLLSLDYGADIVYCEEIIDFKMMQSKRIENDILGTIDYVYKNGTVVFRTCEKEKKKIVFQMGTSDHERALEVAKLIENDVAGIDINMGCPKEFSIKGGMGAALLTQPEKVYKILTTLVNGIKKPVTCKIRILPSLEETLSLVKLIESTGVKALGVHGRVRGQRSSEPCQCHIIRAISETVSIPVIANGGSLHIKKYEDILKFKDETKSSSVMVARSAEWNPSIFRKDGPLDVSEVIPSYLKYAIDYDNEFANTKYCLCQLMHEKMETELGKRLSASKEIKGLCKIYGMDTYLEQTLDRRKKKEEEIKNKNTDNYGPDKKKQKIDNLIILDVRYNRKLYPATDSPKSILHGHVLKCKLLPPVYETESSPDSKLFKSILTVDGKRYSSVSWEKNKRGAEQAAAIAYLETYGIHDGKRTA